MYCNKEFSLTEARLSLFAVTKVVFKNHYYFSDCTTLRRMSSFQTVSTILPFAIFFQIKTGKQTCCVKFMNQYCGRKPLEYFTDQELILSWPCTCTESIESGQNFARRHESDGPPL